MVEYLFVGGPEHGHRIRVEPWCQTYRVLLPQGAALVEPPRKPTGSFTMEDVDRYLDNLPRFTVPLYTTYEYRRYARSRSEVIAVYVWAELSKNQAELLVYRTLGWAT